MYTKKEIYNEKEIDVLYPEEGYLLQHKETKLVYGSVTLQEGRKQEDYIEIPEEKEPEEE